MYGNGQAPIFILKDGTQRTRGRSAQSNNIAAAKAVADAVRSTLGPKGMDKMLVDSMGDVVITNDGATILKEMDIDHPAAKMIIEVAKTQSSTATMERPPQLFSPENCSSEAKTSSNQMFTQLSSVKASASQQKKRLNCSKTTESQLTMTTPCSLKSPKRH